MSSMTPFTTLTSHLVPVPHNDVDTDQIIPASYLKVTSKEGLVEGLFARWRYLPDGSLDPSFPLNQNRYQGAEILVAGDNFGCGSSREHAPWALKSWGLRAVISTGFADIFRSNSLKNGLLPVEVDEQTLQQLFSLADEAPETEVSIDVREQTLSLPDGRQVVFPIDPFSKVCLVEGIDQLGYLLAQEPHIIAYEAAHSK
ncbi:MAG: 3-isopropylmalate dehydratase small subunit [Candidatus Promineifilaceae bacterium]|nr:3-isopropylmalate dehydratase small subunit [Candidatus Promineifilaceae bacterium]